MNIRKTSYHEPTSAQCQIRFQFNSAKLSCCNNVWKLLSALLSAILVFQSLPFKASSFAMDTPFISTGFETIKGVLFLSILVALLIIPLQRTVPKQIRSA